MNLKIRKLLAVLIGIVLLLGWYVTAFGAGQIKPIQDMMKFGLDINGGVYVVMEADTELTGQELEATMEQTRAVLDKRVNAMGLSEATVSLEGDKRIRIEMPGVENAEQAIDQIGQTAQLKFLLADGTEVLGGEDVKDAGFASDQDNGGYKIMLEFTGDGTAKFTEATTKAASGAIVSTNEGVQNNAIMIMLDSEIITHPTVSETINLSTCEITRPGGMSLEEASGIAALIRGGALPVSLNEITSSVQTATIGENALHKSVIAGIIGLALVFILMILVYSLLGLMADIALALYVLIIMWVMVGMGSVLTLPGIAALILSIGMAVDANIIIFSRIREELSNGKSVRVSVSEGFRHAVVTVLDAQITTLIAAVVLYEIGSTTVKGFAITLMIGIITSLFTAILVSQVLIGLLAASKRFGKNKYFETGLFGFFNKNAFGNVKLIGKRKIFYIISAVIIIIGLGTGLIRGFNYGIDFTGGTMINIDMGKKVETAEVANELAPLDLDPSIVLAGDESHQIIIKTIKSLDNAQRTEVVETLSSKYGVTTDDVLASEEFGPTVGNELKTNALKSILIAAIGMLLYIIFRFKSWKYGVSSIAGLIHDVLMALAMYGLLGITINNPFIAAILTVVGYSINDTIVVFDRIRENRTLYKKERLENNIDKSISQTMTRSFMTSLTTLLCMIPLTIMVSVSIREFIVPLMIGVFVGTYSSIFLCSPILYEISKKEKVSKYLSATQKK